MSDSQSAEKTLPPVVIGRERFALGALAIMVLNFIMVMVVVALCPLFIGPIIGFSDLGTVNASLAIAHMKPLTLLKACRDLSLFLFLLFSSPIAWCWWGARQYLTANTKGMLIFTACWAIFSYVFEFKHDLLLDGTDANLLFPIILILLLAWRWRQLSDLRVAPRSHP